MFVLTTVGALLCVASLCACAAKATRHLQEGNLGWAAAWFVMWVNSLDVLEKLVK